MKMLFAVALLVCCVACDITNENDSGGGDGMVPDAGVLELDCTPCGDSLGPVLSTVVNSTTIVQYDLCYSRRTHQCYYDCPERDLALADRFCHDTRP